VSNNASQPVTTPAPQVKPEDKLSIGERKEYDRMIASFGKIIDVKVDPATALVRLEQFRNLLVAAHVMVGKFNETMVVLREFRGADYAEGITKISFRDSSKAGRPALSEDARLKNILG